MAIGAIGFADKEFQTRNFIGRENILCRWVAVEDSFHVLIEAGFARIKLPLIRSNRFANVDIDARHSFFLLD